MVAWQFLQSVRLIDLCIHNFRRDLLYAMLYFFLQACTKSSLYNKTARSAFCIQFKSCSMSKWPLNYLQWFILTVLEFLPQHRTQFSWNFHQPFMGCDVIWAVSSFLIERNKSAEKKHIKFVGYWRNERYLTWKFKKNRNSFNSLYSKL